MLVKQDDPTSMRGGLHVPQGKEEYPPIGTVLDIGGLVKDVKKGDRVVFKRKPDSALEAYARAGDEYYGILVLPEENILGVIDGE